jgi:multiple sugar transport system substrate-binding protein
MNKKFWLIKLGCLFFAVILFSSLAYAKGNVVFLGNAGPETNFVREIAPEFESETGIKVIIEDTPWPQLFEKLSMEIVSGSGAYNIITVPSEWLTQLQRFLTPLNKSSAGIDEDFLPSLLNGYIVDNKLYGVPFFFNVLLTFYRTDIYEEAGVQIPNTWDEYVNVMKTIKEKAGDKILAPAVLPLSRGSHNFVEYMQYLWSFGGSLLDENGKGNLESDEAYKALKFMYDQYHTWGIIPQSSFELSYIESGELFSQGRIATTFEWPRRIGLSNNPETSKVIGKWGVYPRPGTPWLGTWGLSIPSNSSNKDAAYKFISWITNKENMNRLALRGILVSRKSVLNSPELLAKTPEIDIALKSAEKGNNPPKTIGYEEISQTVALEISEAISNEKSIEDALRDANNKVNSIITK